MNHACTQNMKKKKGVTLKHLKNWFLTLFGLVLIVLAISFTLVRVAIKSIPDYSIAIQQAVSEQMGMTLKVGLIDAEISWLVPRLNLLDVNIYDESENNHLLHLDEIDLSLDWSSSISTLSFVVGEITLVGLDVQIGVNEKSQLHIQNFLLAENVDKEIDEAGKKVRGFEVDETIKNNLNNLNFKIINSEVLIYDFRQKKKTKVLKNVNLHLINNGKFHVFEVEANLPKKYGEYVHFIMQVEGDLFEYKNLQGDLYLSLDKIQAAPWLDDYWNKLKLSANAQVSGEVWLQWSGTEVSDVVSQLGVSDLAVNYLDKSVNTWNVKKIDALVHWKKENEDWQLDVRDLVVEREGIEWLKPAALTLNVNNSLNQIKLKADFTRIDGFVYLAGMINSTLDVNITWLQLLDKYQPSGVLRNLDVFLPMEHPQEIRLNSQFSQLGVSLPDAEPSQVVNLQGSIEYLNKRTWLTLNTKDAKIKFNTLFRHDIELSDLEGVLEISHQDHIWKVLANTLKINTPHIETQARVNFSMPDNGKAFLDLTMSYKNGDAKSVGRYLPAGIMGEGAVAWIDDALLSGKVTQGKYLFYGNVEDLPFADNQGVSLADFNVEQVDVHYLDGWPNVNNVSANLRFKNDAMQLIAHKGEMYRSKVKSVKVYIDNFVTPNLDVKGKIDTQLSDIKTFVDSSALKEMVTDYVDNLQFSGKGDLDLDIFLPLYGDFETEIGGKLKLDNGGLKFINEKYEFHSINGDIQFAGENVESSDLTAEMTGNIENKKLDVKIKTNISPAGTSYFIGAQGEVLAPLLLAPVPDFQSKLQGSADWDINIDIGNQQSDALVNILVRSDMQGVTSSFLGVMKENAIDKLPLEFKLDIFSAEKINYALNLNDEQHITVNQSARQIQIKAETKALKGSAVIKVKNDEYSPMKVDLDYLDLNRFVGEAEQNDGLEAGKLEDQQRKSILPTQLPSLVFNAKEIIWKNAHYRNNRLELQKTKVGSVIKSFKLNGRGHKISGKGSWYIAGKGKSVTRLNIGLVADDLGKTFAEYGVKDALVKAKGTTNVRWEWPGAPYEFDWDTLKGDGELDFSDGTFKSFNAGAGRLLGLFNFKTLLSLDFGSQVKEGFHFDDMSGSFSCVKGEIYFDDFLLKSKVADIHMKGQLSFSRNTVNQTVTVKPHIGGTVTLGAAVVAGPTIGGMVYLLQKIFNTDKLSEYQYTMRGNLEKPTVELISAPETELESVDDDEI